MNNKESKNLNIKITQGNEVVSDYSNLSNLNDDINNSKEDEHKVG